MIRGAIAFLAKNTQRRHTPRCVSFRFSECAYITFAIFDYLIPYHAHLAEWANR